MLQECIDALDIKPDGIYFDGTLGGGGHSSEIVKKLGKNGKLVAVDKDSYAIAYSKEKLKKYEDKIIFVNDDFKNAKEFLDKLGIEKLDGVLLDLGVSSKQIDTAERGFSYIKNAPLDMRMNQNQNLSAFDVVNNYSTAELTNIFKKYGEEKFSKRIADKIVELRQEKSIESTEELAELVACCYPAKTRWKYGHPAKRVFQAIRIEVNSELEELAETVEFLARRLKTGGRMAVITFHSLEDRIVKNVFKYMELDCICDKSLPICVCDKISEVKLLTRKPIQASKDELENNTRSESAKLRTIERLKGEKN